MRAEVTTSLLEEYEAQIERSLRAMDSAWQWVASALKTIHDKRLYASYGTWADYCRERWGKQRQWGYKMLEAAEVFANVSHGVHDELLPTSERQIRPLTQLPAAEQPSAWQEAVNRHGQPSGEQVAAVVRERLAAPTPVAPHAPADDGLDTQTQQFFGEDDDLKLEALRADPKGFADTVDRVVASYGEPGGQAVADALDRAAPIDAPAPKPAAYLTSNSDEWYTPPELLGTVRDVLGTIALDPASSREAQDAVQAERWFARSDDGLTIAWDADTVFLNPPYSAVAAWVAKLVGEYEAGRVGAALALVAARVDTQWWQYLLPYPVCFITGRLRFSGAENAATFPSAVVYLGPDVPRFWAAFHRWGPIYRCLEGS